MNLTLMTVFAAATAGEPPAFLSFVPLVLMMVIFYFMLIRPQQKRQKEQDKFLSSLEKNQDVVTLGGLHGTIVAVKQDTVTLRVAENVRVEVDRSAIARSVKSAS